MVERLPAQSLPIISLDQTLALFPNYGKYCLSLSVGLFRQRSVKLSLHDSVQWAEIVLNHDEGCFMRNLFVSSIAVAAIALALAGCNLESESATITGSNGENTIFACSDGIDNDGDGLIDCDDPDCQTQGTREVPGPGMTVCAKTEDNLYTCSDGKDNDGDGFIDCEDNSCKQTQACCITQGNEGDTLESCMDGIDNNCNGYKDCDDFACAKSRIPEVQEYCRKLKCPGDTSPEGACSSLDTSSEKECLLEALASCADGRDNDCNGYVDCADFACSKDSPLPGVIEYCGLVNGTGTSTNETVLEFYQKYGITSPQPENTEETCTDGIDNNLNALTDCEDPECIALNLDYCRGIAKEPPPRPEGFEDASDKVRMLQLKREFEACTDGIDNDHNGRKDCDEYQCHQLSLIKLKGDEATYQINCPSQDSDSADR